MLDIKMKQKNPITTPETPLEVINFATTGQGIATNSDGKKSSYGTLCQEKKSPSIKY